MRQDGMAERCAVLFLSMTGSAAPPAFPGAPLPP